MLTPYFTCTQDEEFVFINIKVSHIRFDAPGVQIIAENELFIFSLSPYYLRLRFDKPLIDDEERSNAHYESKEEVIKVKMPKLNKGEVFQDLDLPQKLLARAVDADLKKDETKEVKRPLIEEIGGKSDLEKTAEEGNAFNWEINQTLEQPSTDLKIKYGFDNRYDSIVGVSLSNGNDINELDDPEHTKADDRIKERLLKENFKFDPEYYAADYMTSKYSEDDPDMYSEIKDLLCWENPIMENPDFTTEENERMLQLPKKTYLITNQKSLYYSILSLLFSYSYDVRENQGDLNIESAWAMGKLTPQISSLDTQIVFNDSKTPLIKALIITGIRRALSYPLHRHYGLAMKAWEDVVKMLQLGKKLVIKALLTLREPFRFHDVYYVYDKILLEDLVNWLINDPKDNDYVFKSLSKELETHLKNLQKNEIVFEQLDDEGDVDTFLDIQEIETLAEAMYLENKQT
ncbi:hypothetical protein WICANDRAFT_35557 [Wickerhamomyces anomalus NRRL Y-366-8]|uniref:CS domain-containing protein n=1 Tax=Wickerhamomyces anomalus (strain ATCC 58044 / CBS 1984 / NCYC 433 / NRRL Y-366-8) TaxID=683960 RepID=A0A1E3NX69_WICAA|nr:uncharacterized protein WICANDRAFT_35557 [Wickerhamomyces anomalus NRRL Y-366-8]ODQ57746.1 hypothetical protein WICANDRAFT_35557 [Wickerhamomyces anomalus NRRL Y-366-8]